MLTWKLKGTKFNRFYFQLQALERRTTEIGSGLWPTPTVDSASDRNSKYAQGGMPLAFFAKLLPTPDASLATGGKLTSLDAVSDSGMTADGKKRQISLPDRLRRMLPTPTVNGNNNRRGSSKKAGDGLTTAARNMLPTPCAQDAKNATCPASQATRDTLPGEIHRQTGGGLLNPRFVAQMMGFPPDWCELPQTKERQNALRVELKSLPQQSETVA
nr:hypothetical protein [Hymenobacter properus]